MRRPSEFFASAPWQGTVHFSDSGAARFSIRQRLANRDSLSITLNHEHALALHDLLGRMLEQAPRFVDHDDVLAEGADDA